MTRLFSRPSPTARWRAAWALAALLATAAPQAQDAAPADDDRDPPLFVVEDDDSRVYLLGSVHLLPEGALPLPAAVEAAYADAEVLAFELDYDRMQAEAPQMMQAAVGETPLAEALTAEQKAAFDAFAAGLGLPAGALDTVEPWMAGLTLAALAAQRSGMTGEGVDAHYFNRAGADGKEREAFETVALQTAVFDDLSTEDQVAFVMAAVEEGPEAMTEALDEMLAAWAAGDDDRLAALVTETADETPTLYEALFTTRNRAWVPQVEALLARDGEDALVVVGAGHLVGDDSVVDLLRRSGYDVRRL
jgi:uncharacterized protein YbaP (TraB family)